MATNFWSSYEEDHPYFQDRSRNPYRSTVALETFLSDVRFFNDIAIEKTVVADLACGTGSDTAYLARRYPGCKFLGVDVERHLIDAAKSRYREFENLRFEQGDLFDLNAVPGWDEVRAIWMAQTLHVLPWYSDALRRIVTPSITKLGFSTLAWDGPNESEVTHYIGGRKESGNDCVRYNVYSLEKLIQLMAELGLGHYATQKFEIDIDLAPPEHRGIGSYTVRTENQDRMLFSTWQHLPWYFLVFSREPLAS